jgi:adenine-specific DNA-methyltransferase
VERTQRSEETADVSRLSNLLREVAAKDPELAGDLRSEVEALSGRRAFGLNFERHIPETAELPGRPIRRGDKVRFLPERGQPVGSVDQRLWSVVAIRRTDEGRIADLVEYVSAAAQEAEKPETVSRACDDLVVVAEFRDPIYPGMVSNGKVERGGDKPFHTVINAENYHGLQALLYTHEGKVDAIYIDPPYNTGARDWTYNNNYVDSDDAYRHSKWLAMMERRLRLAKRLLRPDDSVLIITIDQNEVHRLALLIEQIFAGCKTQMVSSIINPQGISSGAGEFSRVDEYLLFVSVGDAQLTKWVRSMVDNDKEASDVSEDRSVRWADFARYGGNATREKSPGAFFPIFVDIASETIHSVGDALDWDEKVEDVEIPTGTRVVWPPKRPDGSDGRWRVVAETCRELVRDGYIRVGPYNARSERHSFWYLQAGIIAKIETGEVVVTGTDDKGAVIVEFSEGTKTATPKTIWTLPSHDASRHGANLLRSFLPGRRFPFPKSLYAVEDALRFYVKTKPDAVIVDFFAGSGTTAHAVMRLNRQDGGRRQSISVTNNEVSADEAVRLRGEGLRPGDGSWEALGICEYFTKPRIEAAVTGRTPEGEPIQGAYKFTDEFPMVEGFEENAEFFTMTYEAARPVAHHRAFEAIAPLLWLRAGSQGRRIEKAKHDFDLADTYAVLFDLDASQGFLAAIADVESIGLAFLVTDDDRGFQAVCRELPSRVEAVRLYESYLSNFTINTGRE